MKKLVGAALVAGLLVGAMLPAHGKAAPKPAVVFEDAAGDAGINAAGGLPGVAEAGFDLVKGEISQESKTEVKFVVTHATMPATATPGEAFRLIWGITVDGKAYEMTIKSLDVGEPDVVTSAMTQTPTGTERIGQVYQGVARFEECGVINAGIDWSQCKAIAYYDALFDPATGTATWSIDTKTLGVKKGSVISGGSGSRVTTGCMICWVPQYAERSLTPHSIIDAAVQMASYKVR